MKNFRSFFAVISIVLISISQCLTARAQTTRGITPEDYFSFEQISDPQISPDGTQVAYVITTISKEKNRRESSVWVIGIAGSKPAQRWTAEGLSSTNPRWSPDGKTIAILSTRSADPATVVSATPIEKPKAQIYLMRMDTPGDAVPLTKIKNGVQSFQWSPDGKRMVLVSFAGPSDAITAANRKSDVRHYAHIQYKFNDTGWYDDKRQHLWVVTVPNGDIKQLTTGQDWNDADPQWSPDGSQIAFVSDRTGKLFDESHNTDVFVISAAGGDLTKISDHDFEDENPRWSPEGKQIIFTGKTAYHQFAKLYIAPSNPAASRLAVKDLDVIPTELHWPANKAVWFASATRAQTHIFRADLAARTISQITAGERGIHGFDVNAAAGKLVYISSDFQHLDNLYVSNLDGKNELQLTHLNSAILTGLDLQPVERLPYQSSDGWPIDGFFVKPVGWQPGKKYPMVLVIHGGPRGMFGVDWYHEFHVYSAKGWAVFFCNPRGSTSYGEKFERGEINNWGVMDYQDIMSGVDAALKKFPWVDANNLGVTGGSYGGYMTNWIISHTNRFKTAVTLRAVSNFISDDGTRDGAYGHEEYFKGVLFDSFDQYWEASPLKHARNVHTPTLILHSEMDFRVPIEQGEQWFRALQHYGVPSELVVFPRENHNLTRTGEPKHLVESLNWQVYWFDRYLNGNANAQPPDLQ